MPSAALKCAGEVKPIRKGENSMQDNNQSVDPPAKMGEGSKVITKPRHKVLAWCESCRRYIGTQNIDGMLHFAFHRCQHRAGPVRQVVAVAESKAAA